MSALWWPVAAASIPPGFAPTAGPSSLNPGRPRGAWCSPTTTCALYPTPRDRGRAWIEDVAWFPDSTHVLVGMSDGSIAFWCVQPMNCTLHCAAVG